MIAEGAGKEAPEAVGPVGRGETPEGVPGPALLRRVQLPAQLPRRGPVCRLPALCGDEVAPDHGRAGGARQDRAGRGAGQGAQGVGADPRRRSLDKAEG